MKRKQKKEAIQLIKNKEISEIRNKKKQKKKFEHMEKNRETKEIKNNKFLPLRDSLPLICISTFDAHKEY